MLYILTSVWVLRTPNAGRNRHFSFFAVFFLIVFSFSAANQFKIIQNQLLGVNQRLGVPFFCPYFELFWIDLQLKSWKQFKKNGKKGKKDISTSVWCAQHPNAGRNIQQSFLTNFYGLYISHLTHYNYKFLMGLWGQLFHVLRRLLSFDIWALI